MVSATDAWAVGYDPDSSGGTILHYTGSQWIQVTTSISAALVSVAMVSATDGWAVGNMNMGGGGDGERSSTT